MSEHVGELFSLYRLVRFLAAGEHADLYLGKNVYTGTFFTLKMAADPLDEETNEQLITEARLLSRFDHPHIVSVFQIGLHSGRRGDFPFQVQEYISQGSLRNAIRQGTYAAPSDILTYVQQAAAALQYLHDQSLLHRALTPDHLLLGRNQQIKLCGFGMACTILEGQTQRPTAGTLAYMAPEQFAGYTLPASDQYALGIITYEWLCGTPPFQGRPATIMEMHRHAPPPPLTNKRTRIPPAVASVVLMALEKNPQQRFPTVNTFAHALEQAYTHASSSW